MVDETAAHFRLPVIGNSDRVCTLSGWTGTAQDSPMPYTLLIRLIDWPGPDTVRSYSPPTASPHGPLDPDLDLPRLRSRKAQVRQLPEDRGKRGSAVATGAKGAVSKVRRKGKVRDQGGAGVMPLRPSRAKSSPAV